MTNNSTALEISRDELKKLFKRFVDKPRSSEALEDLIEKILVYQITYELNQLGVYRTLENQSTSESIYPEIIAAPLDEALLSLEIEPAELNCILFKHHHPH